MKFGPTQESKQDLAIRRLLTSAHTGLGCTHQIVDLVPPLARLLRSEIAPAIGLGVSLAQFNLLSALSLNETMNNKELAEWLGVSLPVATRQVDNLEKMQLVVRLREDSDRRQVRLKLSGRGRMIQKQVHDRVASALFSKVKELSASDQKSLEKGLRILSALIEQTKRN